jgi:hypothetical protein
MHSCCLTQNSNLYKTLRSAPVAIFYKYILCNILSKLVYLSNRPINTITNTLLRIYKQCCMSKDRRMEPNTIAQQDAGAKQGLKYIIRPTKLYHYECGYKSAVLCTRQQ